MSDIKRTARELIDVAMTTNINRGKDMIYVHYPKNCDYIEFIEAVKNGSTNKHDTLFFTSSYALLNEINKQGYSAHIFDLNTFPAIVNNEPFKSNLKYIIIQNGDDIDHLTYTYFCNILQPRGVLGFICYDTVLPKKRLNISHAPMMYKYDEWNVTKVGRDKATTTVIMYNLKNKLRERKLDFTRFLMDLVTKEPYLRVLKQAVLDIQNIYNINVPILTPHPTMVIPLTKTIRSNLGLDKNGGWLPNSGEWVYVLNDTYGYLENAKKVLITKGMRMKVVEILPYGYGNIENSDDTLQIFKLKGDVWLDNTPTRVTITANDSCLRMFYDEDFTPLKLDRESIANLYTGIQEIANVSFGYVAHSSVVINQVMDTAMVVFNPTLCFSKEELYATIIGIRQSVTIILIGNDNNSPLPY